MLTTAEQFIEDLVLFFPPEKKYGTEETKKLLANYVENITYEIKLTRHKYNFTKLLLLIQREYKFKTLPSVNTILSFMPRAVINEPSAPETPQDGKLLIVKLSDGRQYDFVIKSFGNRTIGGLKKKLREQFGEGFEMKLYPAGTVIIGDRVFLPEEEEQERF